MRHEVFANAYSEDLHKQIPEAAQRSTPKTNVTDAFGVGVSFLKRYIAPAREGRLPPRRGAPARNLTCTSESGSY